MTRILILNQSKSMRKTLHERVEFEGHMVTSAERVDEIELSTTSHPYEMIICDNQFDLLPPQFNTTPLIVVASEPSIQDAMRAAKAGAEEYLTTPIDMNTLLTAIKKGCASHNQEPQLPNRKESANSVRRSQNRRSKGVVTHHIKSDIIGESKHIKHLIATIDKVAQSEARVMILGENGTGKEMVASRLHSRSKRSAAPFIEVNCAAIPSELIESELFGHEKGAFTSAIKQRKGKFEQANGGTLFLDEIGDMSLSAQAKVLRALQERKITRVGSDHDIDVNVRVVAATNKNIRKEIEAGNFREDLYHRLGVIVLRLAPLRERSEDIPLLVEHFLDNICEEYQVERKKICSDAIESLKALNWSGNIRELRNVIERLVVLCDDEIKSDDIKAHCLES